VEVSQRGTNPNNVQMVWGPGTYGVSFDDLSQFYSTFNITASTASVSIPMFKGTPGGDNWGEGSLDASYITAFAPGVSTLVVNSNTSMTTEEGLGFGYAFSEFLFYLGSLSSPYSPLRGHQQTGPQFALPHVLSLSLGSLSWDSCNMMCTMLANRTKYTMKQCVDYMQTQRQVCMYDSSTQADRMNNELMKLGMRGVTILVATGDGGSHFSFEPFAPGGIGDELNVISCQYNFPTFPAASPWVTGVGGIDLQGDPKGTPVAWEGSGSGFSWRFPRPPYQAAVVADYLMKYGNSSGFPSKGSFNATNRAYPDVSAVAIDVPMILDGKEILTGGTSASTPTFAGLISLINDHRLTNKLPSLGFLNPRIYRIAINHPGEAFLDITKGNSKTSCSEGFPAVVGWDPTTGLGSPLFPGLFKYLSTGK